ncbi:MAG TPA: undecaprenyl-phosphate glucose phosphotransferase [Herpetosiphonaceae bacterium]
MATTTLAPADIQRTKRRRYAVMLLLVGLDILATNLGFVISYLWHLPEILAEFQPPSGEQITLALLLFNLVFSVSFWASGLYSLKRGVSRVDEAYLVFRAVAIATVVVIAFNTLWPIINLTNRTVIIGWLNTIVLVSLGRTLYRALLVRLRRRGVDTRRVVIIGAGDIGQLVCRQMRQTPELGYRLVGFLSDETPAGKLIEELPVLGKRRQISELIAVHNVDEVIIALSGTSYGDVLDLVGLVDDESVAIKIYPDAFQLITTNDVSVGELNGLPLISIRTVPLDRSLNRVLKRLLDLSVSMAVLVLLSPLLLLVAVLVRFDSPGPVFFVQERVGRDGKPFKMIKYRSMRVDAESQGTWTRPNDDRRTRLGTFIRRFSIDELPQFINVLLGDMSVVGPRPEQPRYVAQFSESIPRYMHRHREKAGITGWAQVNGLRGDTSIEERTRYDLYYVENWSPLFDLKIILRTAFNTLRGDKSAY